MSLENAKIHYELINNLVKGRNYLALIDATNFYSIEPDAWQYASEKAVAGNRIATANYNVLLPGKIIMDFYKMKYDTAAPVKLFKTRAEARKWLLTFKDQL